MSDECLYCQAPASGPTGFCSSDCAKACIDDRSELVRALKLMERKVITCGVAATHPDPALTRTKKCYAETWNSPQADAVRKLRDERDELRAYRDRTEKALRELCASVTLESREPP